MVMAFTSRSTVVKVSPTWDSKHPNTSGILSFTRLTKIRFGSRLTVRFGVQAVNAALTKQPTVVKHGEKSTAVYRRAKWAGSVFLFLLQMKTTSTQSLKREMTKAVFSVPRTKAKAGLKCQATTPAEIITRKLFATTPTAIRYSRWIHGYIIQPTAVKPLCLQVKILSTSTIMLFG